MLACLLELAHVGVHQRHARLAITPSLKHLLVVAPRHSLATHTMLVEDSGAMLQGKKPACML